MTTSDRPVTDEELAEWLADAQGMVGLPAIEYNLIIMRLIAATREARAQEDYALGLHRRQIAMMSSLEAKLAETEERLREARAECDVINEARLEYMASARLGQAKLAEIRAVVKEQLGYDIWHAPGTGIYERYLRRLHEVIGE